MDFFDRQEAARKNSRRLVVMFSLAVLAVSLAVGLVASLGVATGAKKARLSVDGEVVRPGLWNPPVFFGAGGVTMGVILLGSLFKSMSLSAGGPAVARSLGGRKIDPNTTDADERKLLNVVEEMSIASGVPVPDVYLLEQEHGINAFAAGRTTSDAVIGATRGCIKLLSRDELQGVVAHEFSHILNGDMRLNLRLMGLLFGIVMITVFGRILLRSAFYSGHGGHRRSSRDNGGGIIAIAGFGLALVVIGYLGVLLAHLIKAAVSRQREFLADASAVQFTRNPDGIGGALKKIGGLSYGSRVVDPHAEEASHMFFANGLAEKFTSAFATHPPLPDRIKAIEPGWDGRFPRVSLPQVSSSISSGAEDVRSAAAGIAALAGGGAPARDIGQRRAAASVPQRPAGSGNAAIDAFFAAVSGSSAAGAGRDPAGPASARAALAEPDQVSRARQLHESLPEHWLAAAHNEAGAQALIFAMLLAQDDDLRAGELDMLAAELDPDAARTVMTLHGEFGDLHSTQKIALIDLSLPALRRLSPGEYDRFRTLMGRLIASDKQVDLFEFMLEKVVRRHLDIAFERSAPPKTRYRALAPLADHAAVLVSTLAFLGLEDEAEGRAAFAAGAKVLEPEIGGRLPLKGPAECGLQRIDAALREFEQAAPTVQRTLLVACGNAVVHDGIIASDEAELLRAIADAIGTSIPPFVGG